MRAARIEVRGASEVDHVRGQEPLPHRRLRRENVQAGDLKTNRDVLRRQVLRIPDIQQHRKRPGRPAATHSDDVAGRTIRANLFAG